MIIEIFAFVILFAPYVWEVYNDRHGDPDKVKDVLIRIAIAAGVTLTNVWLTGRSVWPVGFMCFALFFLLFDYTVAAVLGIKDWFSFLGTTSFIDRIKWWREMSPGWRFAVRIGVMAWAILFYF